MALNTLKSIIVGVATTALLSACGTQPTATSGAAPRNGETSQADLARNSTGTTIWEAFGASRNAERTVNVNKYLWAASFEVLDFLPVESVDPFSGIILTGYGTPPGSGRAYRATILIDDPALDARALNVSLQTRNGPASASAVRAVENAILSRARQLRIADDRL